MNAIRKKILISSLNINYRFNRSLSKILSIFTKNDILDSINSDALLKILLKMIETREFFDVYDELYEIEPIISSLNNDQKRQFYEKIIRSQNPPIDLFSDYSVMSDCTVEVLGELLYDIDFLNCLPKSGDFIKFPIGISKLSDCRNQMDILKIINNKDLFTFYSKYTDLLRNEINNVSNLSEEQIKQLIIDKNYWALKYTDLKYDESFIQKLIMDCPKAAPAILKELPDSVKNSKNIKLALLICKRVDLIDEMELKKENLYNAFIDEMKNQFQTGVLKCKDLNIDVVLYSILVRDIGRASKVDGEYIREIYENCTDDEKKNIRLSYPNLELDVELKNEIENISLNNLNSKKIRNILYLNNKVFNHKISEEQIDSFIKENSVLVNKLIHISNFYSYEKIANNLYHSICNGTTDLFEFFLDSGKAELVCMYYITPELVNKLGKELIAQIAIYPENFYFLLTLEKEGKLELYKELVKKFQNVPIDKVRVNNTLIYSCIAFPNLIKKLLETNSLNYEEILNITQSPTIVSIDNLNSIEEYYQVLQQFCDKNISTTTNISVLKELICQRFFRTSFNYVLEFYNSFKDSVHNIKDDQVKQLLNKIENIINSDNLEQLKSIYFDILNSNLTNNFTNLLNLTNILKEEVIGTIAKGDYSNVSEVIDMTGKNFEMLVHVVGAYGATIPADNMYESWNSNLVIENTGICTSLLNDNYFGHAKRDKNSVIFGFSSVSALDVQMMATYDLSSNAYGMKSNSFRSSSYLSPSDLLINSRSPHNEVVINRNLTNGQKRQPDYILCFDTINRESKRASKQFGIPIVFIDVKKHLQIKLQEIDALKQSFVSTQSIEIMKKIINMQETIRCGLLANNEDLAQSLFNSKNITSNILFLIENIKELETLDQLEIILNSEKDRSIDEGDNKNIVFSGDLDLIFERLNKKRQELSDSKALLEFKNARENQKQQDQVIREQQLTKLEIVETKEGHSLK